MHPQVFQHVICPNGQLLCYRSKVRDPKLFCCLAQATFLSCLPFGLSLTRLDSFRPSRNVPIFNFAEIELPQATHLLGRHLSLFHPYVGNLGTPLTNWIYYFRGCTRHFAMICDLHSPTRLTLTSLTQGSPSRAQGHRQRPMSFRKMDLECSIHRASPARLNVSKSDLDGSYHNTIL